MRKPYYNYTEVISTAGATVLFSRFTKHSMQGKIEAREK